jgi:hypothetical protein
MFGTRDVLAAYFPNHFGGVLRVRNHPWRRIGENRRSRNGRECSCQLAIQLAGPGFFSEFGNRNSLRRCFVVFGYAWTRAQD